MVIWNPKDLWWTVTTSPLTCWCVSKSHMQLEKCNFSLLPESARSVFFAHCTTFIYNFRKKKINNETWIITHDVTGFHIPHYWRLIYLLPSAGIWSKTNRCKNESWLHESCLTLSLCPLPLWLWVREKVCHTQTHWQPVTEEMKGALQSPRQEYVFIVVTSLENESLMLFFCDNYIDPGWYSKERRKSWETESILCSMHSLR